MAVQTFRYQARDHRTLVEDGARLLRRGLVVAFPTDTSYALGVDATNPRAVLRLYRTKERTFKKPVHVVVPSLSYARRLTVWPPAARALARAFWPGPLTLVLRLRSKNPSLKKLTGGTGYLGLRFPKQRFARDLCRRLGHPVTATSANPSGRLGGVDSYSKDEVLAQFEGRRHRPDAVIDGGRLPRRKPSTVVRVDGGSVEILREGPISAGRIWRAAKATVGLR